MTATRNGMMRVLLVQMPFFTVDTPSISLTLVKAALERAGHECDIACFNLEFGRRLGVELYSWIAGSAQPDFLFGDLVFAPSLHDKPVSVQRQYCEYMARLRQGDTSRIPRLDQLYAAAAGGGVQELQPA